MLFDKREAQKWCTIKFSVMRKIRSDIIISIPIFICIYTYRRIIYGALTKGINYIDCQLYT